MFVDDSFSITPSYVLGSNGSFEYGCSRWPLEIWIQIWYGDHQLVREKSIMPWDGGLIDGKFGRANGMITWKVFVATVPSADRRYPSVINFWREPRRCIMCIINRMNLLFALLSFLLLFLLDIVSSVIIARYFPLEKINIRYHKNSWTDAAWLILLQDYVQLYIYEYSYACGYTTGGQRSFRWIQLFSEYFVYLCLIPIFICSSMATVERILVKSFTIPHFLHTGEPPLNFGLGVHEKIIILIYLIFRIIADGVELLH